MWKTKLRILCFVGSGNWGRGSTGTKKETAGTRKVPGRYRNQVGNGRPFKTFELKTITFPASQFFNLHFLTILKPQFIHIKPQILHQRKQYSEYRILMILSTIRCGNLICRIWSFIIQNPSNIF